MFANYQLSRTYFIQGKLDTALFYAQRELELYPENKRTYYILGLTLGYMNREEEAIDAFGKFIEWKPSTWAGRNDKAWLEFRIGRIDDAITTMTPITVYTDNPWIQNTYGTLLLNKGKYDEAKIAFTYAQRITDAMTEETWGKAYPGNDPRIYGTGLRAMKLSIANNLELIKKEQEKK
jgi:tetratricopeptide (TPR) repeat protein